MTQASDGLEAVARPRPRITKAVELPGVVLARILDGGRAGGLRAAALVDVDTGEIVESAGTEAPMPTASVVKLVTTLYALDQLGADFQYVTRLLGTGPVLEGVLQGDLVLVGSGDPALDTDELGALARDLRNQGVTSITGRFLFDADALPGRRELVAGQPDHVAYNPGISGLNLNFNRVLAEWGPGGDPLTLTARAERLGPPARGIGVELRDGQTDIFAYREEQGGAVWSLDPGALSREGGRWLPVRDPAPYAASAFRDVAQEMGLSLPQPQAGTAEGRELASFNRRDLALVCRGMLHFSTNVTAEALGLTASRAADAEASAADMTAWTSTRFAVNTASFADHSGLNEDTRISAPDMARILAKAGREGTLDGLVRRHPVQERGGSRPVRPDVEVRAKTGTLNFVRGLGGFVLVPDGRRYAFAIFSADLAARKAADNRIEMPPGARAFNYRAVDLEQAVLRHWIDTYAR